MEEITKSNNANLTLIDIISDEDFLFKAWKKLNKGKKKSRGVSEETIEIFENSLSTNIKTISYQLKKGLYKLSPVRGVLIEKPGKEDKRPLRVPEVRDRLV